MHGCSFLEHITHGLCCFREENVSRLEVGLLDGEPGYSEHDESQNNRQPIDVELAQGDIIILPICRPGSLHHTLSSLDVPNHNSIYGKSGHLSHIWSEGETADSL